MINVNELRVGNTLLHKPHPNKEATLHKITADDIFRISVNAQHLFSPVVVTHSILDSIGFVQNLSFFNKLYHNFCNVKTGQYLVIHIDQDYSSYVCYSDILDMKYYEKLYLHTLQNLYFALTGEELN